MEEVYICDKRTFSYCLAFATPIMKMEKFMPIASICGFWGQTFSPSTSLTGQFLLVVNIGHPLTVELPGGEFIQTCAVE